MLLEIEDLHTHFSTPRGIVRAVDGVSLRVAAGETLGIGILRHIHFTGHRIEVLTAEGIEGILGIQWSHTRMEPSGELRRSPMATT